MEKKGRKHIASYKKINDRKNGEKNFINTILGILYRIAGECRKLYQIKESLNSGKDMAFLDELDENIKEKITSEEDNSSDSSDSIDIEASWVDMCRWSCWPWSELKQLKNYRMGNK